MYQSNSKYYVRSTVSQTQAAGTTFLLSKDFELGQDLETGTDSVSFVLKNGAQIERFEITATGGTATIVKRGLTQSQTSTASVGNQKQWTDGSVGYVTALAYDIPNNRNLKPLRVTVPTVADNTARSALYPSPTGGEKVVNTSASGAEQRYNAVTAQWETLGTSTPVPNATTAAAGIVELATTAETKAGTSTGGTGASLVAIPSDIAANEQSGTFVYAVSSDVSDTYTASLTPAITAYAAGMEIRVKFTTANTGACTLNVNSLGAKAIKTESGSDPLDSDITAGSIRSLVYDGTNFVLRHSPATNLSLVHSLITDSIGAVTTGLSFGTNYQASAAGFVNAYVTGYDNYFQQGGTTVGYTDSSATPSTVVASKKAYYAGNDVDQAATLVFPVKKGDYWRVDTPTNGGYPLTRTLRFVPFQ